MLAFGDKGLLTIFHFREEEHTAMMIWTDLFWGKLGPADPEKLSSIYKHFQLSLKHLAI